MTSFNDKYAHLWNKKGNSPKSAKPQSPKQPIQWTCSICTFAGNSSHSESCSVCGAVNLLKSNQDIYNSHHSNTNDPSVPPPPQRQSSRYRSQSNIPQKKSSTNTSFRRIESHKVPSSTTGISTQNKRFAFNIKTNSQSKKPHTNSKRTNLTSPKSRHTTKNSLNLESNPLAKVIDELKNEPGSNTSNHAQSKQHFSSQPTVNINIEDSDSYSWDGNNIDDMDIFPPGYTESGNARISTRSRHQRESSNLNSFKRRKSNRKDIWRRMVQSVGMVGGLAKNGMGYIQEDDDDGLDDYKLSIQPNGSIRHSNNNKNNGKYATNGADRIFKHRGYKINRRFSSHEAIHSRYVAKCARRRNRPRSKSDPYLMRHTMRFDRKLETEYRPGTMNFFQLNKNINNQDINDDQKQQNHKFIESRAHKDSLNFRYLFDDSDFEDDSFDEWSEDELDSILRSYDLEEPDVDYKSNHKLNSASSKAKSNASALSKFKSIKDFSKSLPGSVGKGIDKMKAKNLKKPLAPYGGHVYASNDQIEDEFGMMESHILEFKVKKRNKFGRDKARILVVDIPLQVLRIKDMNKKTHKEHIVSSISQHAIVGNKNESLQIIIKFHDNRDYFLTFEYTKDLLQFQNILNKLQDFHHKMAKRSHKNTTMSSTLNVSTTTHSRLHSASVSSAAHNTTFKSLKPAKNGNTLGTKDADGYFDDDDEFSVSHTLQTPMGNTPGGSGGATGATRNRSRFDTELFDEALDDGQEYTGVRSENVVYRITKINKWGTKKERTMIVHKTDRTVRLFDDKRRCHSEYPLSMMATLDIIDTTNIEVVFTSNQKPTRLVFVNYVDLCDFVEQITTIAPEMMVNNSKKFGGGSSKGTITAKKNAHRESDMLGLATNDENDFKDIAGLDIAYDVNPNVLRYSVLRLIRSGKAPVSLKGHQKANSQVIWRQHRRVIYLDLSQRLIRMLTLGMHIKDYPFNDVLLLEKSYINVNQLHITCKSKKKIKEYWYEFISPQARAEFVGRLLRALPGTKQQNNGNVYKYSDNESASNSNSNKDLHSVHENKPSVHIQQLYPNGVDTTSALSPRNKNNKKNKRKKISAATMNEMIDYNNINNNLDAYGDNKDDNFAAYGTSSLDVKDLDDGNTHSYKIGSSKSSGSDALSLIVASWNVSDSEINFANLKMWIPTSLNEQHDIYVLGLQECATNLRKQWIHGILKHIDCNRKEYVLLNKAWLMAIGIIIIVHRAHISKISHLHSQVVPTGKGNIIGNKGATAISFQFQETSFVFINAHLAARAERFEKRAKNFYRIIKHLELGRPGLDILHQFTHTFFIGDLNYRIERDFYETVGLVKQKQWKELIKSDQLALQMKNNGVFYGFKEGKIDFCPTYRWERNRNTISNKRNQPPSYCDRILYKSLPQSYDLWQECYLSSHKCFGSDHRPVWSLFKFRPRMPFFSLKSHDDPSNSNEQEQYSDISISLLEVRAHLKYNRGNSAFGEKKSGALLHLDDTLDCILHYNYCSKAIIIKGGVYDKQHNCFRWPVDILDALKLKPFISDPEFLCRTHIFVSFINRSKNNINLGYSVISLFNAFPKSLVNTKKLINEFIHNSRQMELMGHTLDDDINGNIQKQFINNTSSANQEFAVPILLNGSYCGELKGFIYAEGKLIEKHRRMTNLDLISSLNNPQQKIENDLYEQSNLKGNQSPEITEMQKNAISQMKQSKGKIFKKKKNKKFKPFK